MIGQDGRWVTVSAGDIVALRTDCPFTLTYPRPIRQMVLSVSQEEFVGIYGRRISGLEYLSRTEIGGHAFQWMIRRFGDHLAEKADGCADDIFELGMGMLAQMFDRDPALRNNRLPRISWQRRRGLPITFLISILARPTSPGAGRFGAPSQPAVLRSENNRCPHHQGAAPSACASYALGYGPYAAGYRRDRLLVRLFRSILV
jgi:hypothetical protein